MARKIAKTLMSKVDNMSKEEVFAYSALAGMMAIQYYQSKQGHGFEYFPKKIGRGIGQVLFGAISGVIQAMPDYGKDGKHDPIAGMAAFASNFIGPPPIPSMVTEAATGWNPREWAVKKAMGLI